MTTRFIPDPTGRESDGPGRVIDLADVDALHASGVVLVGGVGATSARAAWLSGLGIVVVSTPYPPNYYYDTTLSKLIFHDGTTWRDPATGNTV